MASGATVAGIGTAAAGSSAAAITSTLATIEALLGAVWRPELLLRLQRRLPLVVLFTGYGNGSLINRYSPVKEQRGYLNALGDNGFYIMGAFILAD